MNKPNIDHAANTGNGPVASTPLPETQGAELRDEILNSPILVGSPTGAEDLTGLLQEKGYTQVALQPDPEKIVRDFSKRSSRLLIVDVERLGERGIEIVRETVGNLKTSCSSVLALVQKHDDTLRTAALTVGARDTIARPIDPVETIVRIRNRLEFCALIERVNDQNENLERTISERTRQLNASHLDLVHRLARASEFRDNDTGNHVARMSLYAAELGRAAGLNEHECQLLLNASALHDIGKIGIADRVLLKPGAHDPEETRAMRTHVDMGVAILSGSEHELIQWAEIIARTHHERWDGTGYPNGLKGEDIPLVGRIVAICDVFDALSSVRPYKKAWPLEDAVNEIRNGSGTHFDPRLVDLFLKILPRLTMIQNSYAAALTEFYS